MGLRSPDLGFAPLRGIASTPALRKESPPGGVVAARSLPSASHLCYGVDMYSGPDSKLIDVPAPTGALSPEKRRGLALLPAEARFLYEYTRSGNVREALEAADYHPSTDAIARDMANEILRKVDTVSSCREALEAAGMGQAEWIRGLYRLAQEDNPKWGIAAFKLWGLALGTFSEKPAGQGASINIHVGGPPYPKHPQQALPGRLQIPTRGALPDPRETTPADYAPPDPR